MRFVTTLLALIFLTTPVAALEAVEKDHATESVKAYRTVPVNISFLPYEGWGGKNEDVISWFALNILAGSTAKLHGFAVGGLANIATEEMKGVQIGGLANVVGDNAWGGQISGLANVVGEDASGVQVGGLANVIGKSARVIQFGGLANIAGESLTGMQTGGFANIVGEQAHGIQTSAFANVVGSHMRGIQISGFANVVGDTMQGLQISGFANVANHSSGIQIAPFNAAGTSDGIPIGLYSRVMDTPVRTRVWTDETRFVNFGLKSGNSRFHNTVIIAVQPEQFRDPARWALGAGVGFKMGYDPIFADISAYHMHINEDEWWTTKTNSLSKLQATVGFRISPRLALIGGLSWNVFVSTKTDGSDFAPWSAWRNKDVQVRINEYGDIIGYVPGTFVRMWPGVHIGLEF